MRLAWCDGPVHVSASHSTALASHDAIESARELGYAWLDDRWRGHRREFPDRSCAKEHRHRLPAEWCLTISLGRGIEPDAHSGTDRVLVEDGRATGVLLPMARCCGDENHRLRWRVRVAGYPAPPGIGQPSTCTAGHPARPTPGVGEHCGSPLYLPYTSGLTMWPIKAGRQTNRQAFVRSSCGALESGERGDRPASILVRSKMPQPGSDVQTAAFH